MKRFSNAPIGALVLLLCLFSCAQQDRKSFQAPVFEGLGNHSLKVTTISDDAQMFFDQGLTLSYGFNHLEAARSFREAIRLDSTFAMAYWGLAYVLGPNINEGMNPDHLQEAYEASGKAMQYSSNLPEWEQLMIQAINARYDEPDKGRDGLDQAYADAMRKAYARFPNMDDVAFITAESLMDLHPWDYWEKDGAMKPWTPEFLEMIEKGLETNPYHPLGNHLNIHATEASLSPQDGLESARILETLTPNAGHLVHMPSHTYIRTGDYHLGTLANERAVIVDSIYVATCVTSGTYPLALYPHNYHFLTATAALEGAGAKAIQAAFKLAEITDKQAMRQDGWGTLQHFTTIPYNLLVKFAQWEKILALPAPDADLLYPMAVWQYAQGMARANMGDIEAAMKALGSIKDAIGRQELIDLTIWDINTVNDLVEISYYTLAGEIAMRNGENAKAEKLLLEAIELEDQLSYNEPPDWFFSIRHSLGDLYIRMSEYRKAEKVYREDLATFPRNGFALKGLHAALLGQQKDEEAIMVMKQFNEAWKYADVVLEYSRIDTKSREDLKIVIDDKIPSDLMAIALQYCGIDRLRN